VLGYDHVVGEHGWVEFVELASYRFPLKGGRVTAFAHEGVRTELIRDAYERAVLPVALQASGREVLHASANVSPLGVIAMCGPSGIGKSTIARALAERPLPQWADDAVVLEVARSAIEAVAVPFAPRLWPDAARYFASREGTRPWRGPSAAARRAPLALLVVLEREKRSWRRRAVVEVEPLRAADAFAAVLPHAYCFRLGDLARKRRMMRQYLEICSRVPVVSVRFRPGLENLPAILAAIEQSAASLRHPQASVRANTRALSSSTASVVAGGDRTRRSITPAVNHA